MKLIGLTGGIASGKSTIARSLAARGAVHIDADQLARDAVAPGSAGLRRIQERFGDEVITSEGALDRAALGTLVFTSPELRQQLEAIVHPAVRELAAQRIAEAKRADADAIVVYDVPLLVEAKVSMPWDMVVVAEAPAATRLERLVSLRGMDRDEAQARIASQASDEERRAVADLVIDTGGTEAYTEQQTSELWATLTANSKRS